MPADATRVLMIGFGTVGRGLARLVLDTYPDVESAPLRVVGIGDMLQGSVHAPEGVDLSDALARVERGESLSGLPGGFDGDALELISESVADVMVEATYTDLETAEPASSHVRESLERGMHVVMSNKGPMALHFRELTDRARSGGVRLLFESTVLSGTPVFSLIRECLVASGITEIRGILNGTCNYTLTRMANGATYDDALARAQDLGYAEAEPDADVGGWDALAKVTILANAVFGADADPADFPREGITEITADAIAEAASWDARIKLIGRVWKDSDGVHGSVEPGEVPSSDFLYGVDGALNALTISTDALGDVSITGPGAGGRETGYGLLADILRTRSDG